MKKRILLYMRFMILLTAILFIGGCSKELREPLEKTMIPELNNSTELIEASEASEATETEKETETETTTVTRSKPEVVMTPYRRPFEAYIQQNNDFMGWIKIDGTSIDAPVVQGDDNAHYLEYDFSNTKNISGAIFLDYKNQGNFYDNHMSLYAHYMEDGTMFHDLHDYKDEAFLSANPEIILSGLRETKKYEIFSVHIVSAYDYYLYLDLNDDALKEYAAHFQRLSMFDKSVTFPEDLKLLTLVTCTYEFENARLLIHAYQK